jgi:mono/diheme cytochrome c family protein
MPRVVACRLVRPRRHRIRVTLRSCPRWAVCVVIATTVVAAGWIRRASATDESSSAAVYLDEVKHVLHERCLACHGALKQEGGLRLDTAAGLITGGDSGPPVVAGRPDESFLLARLRAASPEERMPPEGAALTPDQIAAITRWIASGAAAPADERPEEDPSRHWSFQAPVRPPLPVVQGSATETAGHPVDAFIDAGLAAAGIEPRGAADKATLLRRVTLDLIGVPPTREELHAFLADGSPEAYDRVVDRLLASPLHGERWGRHWMDVWRYSDWHGRRMVNDVRSSAGQIYRWRDWIVDSLNDNAPYDAMVRDMIAADEVRPGDREAAVATGFLVRSYFSMNQNDWLRSVVEHTGKAFLGLTTNCAHCHDHKYDPLTQEEYFAFRAFFEPMWVRQDRWVGEADPGPFEEYVYGGSRKVQRVGSVQVFDKSPDKPTWFYTGGDERNLRQERGPVAPAVPRFLAGGRSLDIRTVELPPTAFYPGAAAEIRRTVLEEAIRSHDEARQRLAEVRRDVQSPTPAMLAELDDAQGALERAQVDASQAGASAADATGVAALEARRDAARWAIELPALEVRAAEADAEAKAALLVSIRSRLAADAARYGLADDGADGPPEALATSAAASEATAAVAIARADVLARERAVAAAETATRADASQDDLAKREKQVKTARTAWDEAQKKLAAAEEKLATSSPGDYTPVSGVYPAQSTGRRKALAEWLTAADNPLFARVAVNHIWTRHFLRPLVETVFDFGRGGAAPTHPELLDWLAVEFIASGHDMKHMHRLMVTSRAYRRVSSAGTGPQAARDPDNRLLWRMHVGRMEAEVVRDSILHVAGALDQTRGGPELESKDVLATTRRSLYYSCHPEEGGKGPIGELFDGPDANDCYRRSRTVVPQQALALANSALVHEQSANIVKLLAGPEPPTPDTSLDAASGDRVDDTGGFVDRAFEQILSRPPAPEERSFCVAFLASTAESVDANGVDAARDVRRRGLVRVLLNHNDFVAIR